MGRKSRQRRKNGGLEDLEHPVDHMTLDYDEDEKPRSAKQVAKMKKKLKKQLKKQLKEKGRKPSQREKLAATGLIKHPGWHSLKVSGGEPVEKHFLYTSIGNLIDVEFQPLGFHKIDKMICFYLEGSEAAATAIGGLNKRLQGPDGSLLKIVVANCSPPDLVLNSDQIKVLREVMSRRFNGASCLLDLTDLHHDSELVERDILAPLTCPSIFKQVLKMIKEYVPQLKALNLSKNSLKVGCLKMLQNLHTSSSQLSALNLCNNFISDIQVFKLIKMFPLTELSLEFNPLVSQFKEKPVKYVLHVKKELPSIKLLDSVDVDVYLAKNDMPKLVQEPNLLSGESATSSSSPAMSEEMVRTYLEQYYSFMDTQERANLVAAYTPDAVMEIKSSIDSIGSCVFMGQRKISEALAQLPASQHQHSSLSVDIKVLNANAAQAMVRGQCRLAGVDTVITFFRSMNIIPYNAGLCCSQDLLEMR